MRAGSRFEACQIGVGPATEAALYLFWATRRIRLDFMSQPANLGALFLFFLFLSFFQPLLIPHLKSHSIRWRQTGEKAAAKSLLLKKILKAKEAV